jgi:phosphatidylglycerophosphatase C
VVAAFDFDGTLTRSDTLFGFVRRLCGMPALARAAAVQSAPLGAAAVGLRDRDQAKADLLFRLLAGRPLADVAALVPGYVDALVARRLRPDVLARVTWHRAQGHELVVISASPELYVGPTSERIGIGTTLATRLEVDEDLLTGRLLGGNVRGPEKVARLREWLGGERVTLWAYGNSPSDRPLLESADVPVWVGRQPIEPHG